MLGRHPSRPFLYRMAMDARTVPPRARCGLIGGDRFGPGDPNGEITQGDNFSQLFFGVGQPAFKLGIQLAFIAQRDRHVLQGAGRRDEKTLWPKEGEGFFQLRQNRGKVAAPDVAAIHHPQRKQFLAVGFAQNRFEFTRFPHEVDVESIDGQV